MAFLNVANLNARCPQKANFESTINILSDIEEQAYISQVSQTENGISTADANTGNHLAEAMMESFYVSPDGLQTAHIVDTNLPVFKNTLRKYYLPTSW